MSENVFGDYDPFKNDAYAQIVGWKYKNLIQQLEFRILNDNTGEGKFGVVSIEAGVGKSIQTNRIIMDRILDFTETPHRYLIVKPFKKDVLDCQKYISIQPAKISLGITNENWSEWKKNLDGLESFKVLIITQARYVDLCLDEELKSYFTTGRDTLIIDERVNFPIHTFSEQIYKKAINILPVPLHKSLVEICQPLFNELIRCHQMKNSNNKLIVCEPSIDIELLKNFVENVLANLTHIDFNERENVKGFLTSLEVLYSSKGLFNNGSISTFNRKYRLWGLRNNIILDANGSIDATYKTPKYISICLDKTIIDHSNSTLTWIDQKTSYSGIRESKSKYFAEIASLLTINIKPSDKALIVIQNEFENDLDRYLREFGFTSIGVADSYNGEKIAINHFGNLIGKNLYSDFSQCWILGTPNIPMHSHVIHWMQYNQSELLDDSVEMARGKKKYSFKEKVFEEIRITHTIGEIYQSLKRVQRNPIPHAKFFVANSDPDVIDGVARLLKNVKRETVLLNINSDNNKKSDTTNNKDLAILSFFKTKDEGVYSKSELCNSAGIEKAHLSRYWKDAEILKLIEPEIISIGHKSITIKKS